MNNNIKILLNIEGIEGATIHTEGRYKVPYTLTKGDLHWMKHHKTYTKEDKDKVVYKGIRKVRRMTVIPCTKALKLTKDAYDYFTSNASPEWYFKKNWSRLSKEEKLAIHFQRICEHNGGDSYSYSILED